MFSKKHEKDLEKWDFYLEPRQARELLDILVKGVLTSTHAVKRRKTCVFANVVWTRTNQDKEWWKKGKNRWRYKLVTFSNGGCNACRHSPPRAAAFWCTVVNTLSVHWCTARTSLTSTLAACKRWETVVLLPIYTRVSTDRVLWNQTYACTHCSHGHLQKTASDQTKEIYSKSESALLI